MTLFDSAFVVGDEGPQHPYQVTIRNADGTAKNLTGFRVDLEFKERDLGTTMSKLAGIDDAANGKVSIAWATGDLAATGVWYVWAKVDDQVAPPNNTTYRVFVGRVFVRPSQTEWTVTG